MAQILPYAIYHFGRHVLFFGAVCRAVPVDVLILSSHFHFYGTGYLTDHGPLCEYLAYKVVSCMKPWFGLPKRF